MPAITMKELLEAGVHFGHRTHRWNPKMKRYIYGSRNGIYIIDLHQTLKLFEDAREFIQEVASAGENVLFVGTKKQAQEAVESAAKACGMYYVNQRWLGGMLTNFSTIQTRIGRLRELEKMEEDGVFEQLTKKEAAKLREQRDKLEGYLGGIKDMPGMPGVVFIVDLKKERIALLEARKLDIPVVAIVDTNCDPDEVDYVIPGNDDAIRAIKLMAGKMAEAINEVRPMPEVEETEEETEDIAEGEESEGDDSTEAVESDEQIFIEAPEAAEAAPDADEATVTTEEE